MSINAITIDTLSFIHHSVCSWHIFIIFSSSQFCTSPNQAFHYVIKACDKCSFFSLFYFLSILACQWNANCAFRKCTEIKQHRNLLSFFSWSHNCLFFMTTLWIYGRLLAFAIMTMLTVCYCVGSPARQCLTNICWNSYFAWVYQLLFYRML